MVLIISITLIAATVVMGYMLTCHQASAAMIAGENQRQLSRQEVADLNIQTGLILPAARQKTGPASATLPGLQNTGQTMRQVQAINRLNQLQQ